MANDTFELTSSLIRGATEKENAAKANDLKIYTEKPLRYAISPLYARYVGNTITVAFNGNFRKFPVSGEEFSISKGHYDALMKYLHHIDRQIRLAQQNAKFMGQHVSGDFKKI